MADPRLRQLTIKTGVVKRLTKEKTVCEKEVGIEQKRLERFKSEGADEHVLRKQQEVISECLMMVPDTLHRLKRELEALTKFLSDEEELKETKEYETATQVVNEAKNVLANTN
ncbi:tubulin-specific chaperone A [Anastrepha obliqua]|uniref:tubulin-specific chaperone A n=1 Tax=Anastrepha ludens TaxID=28586 RepID=UPI0023B141B6|nr:tubulin-specific chaperone A [Anastrepha ludens]XP_053962229.1 tubulin-specific chaperone A [Anastrepha ludens]XP_054738838.1 tubulin-specific chaperone A [Anastrepha obliqua]XP_054738846.1 tubulin-specific chaperone A [Anastrepha obliqua]